MKKQTFTLKEIADFCKEAERTVSKWFDSGRLVGHRDSENKRTVPRENLIKFLKAYGRPLGDLEETDTDKENVNSSFLEELFETEYCAECGGDADDHQEIEVIGNPFALCLHPLPEDMSEQEIEVELERRRNNKNSGLPMIEGK
jgi:hypothetical protein